MLAPASAPLEIIGTSLALILEVLTLPAVWNCEINVEYDAKSMHDSASVAERIIGSPYLLVKNVAYRENSDSQE